MQNLSAPPLTILGQLQLQIHAGQPVAALTIDEIDACVLELESAERLLKAAKETHDEVKDALIALVKTHGSVPAGADQSKRLVGRRNILTVTTGTTTTLDDSAIEALASYCDEQYLRNAVFPKLFSTETKYKLVSGAHKVLAAVELPKRTHEKLLSLFGRCFKIDSKSPSLKYSVIVPEKLPKKPRAGKVAA